MASEHSNKPSHLDRDRADSFGQVANDYDRYRPRYPQELIEAVLGGRKDPRLLDVGAGTGILGRQLIAAGASVVAIEPDPQMAEKARSLGLDTEISTFEDWEPAGRTFDIVTFGQSFHWVDPAIALPKIRTLLDPGGTLALAWNNVEPQGEPAEALRQALWTFGTEAATVPSSPPPTETAEDPVEHPALPKLRKAGFETEELHFDEALSYERDAWLSLLFTYSAQLTMPLEQQERLRQELAALIPDTGLNANNGALLLLARVRSG